MYQVTILDGDNVVFDKTYNRKEEIDFDGNTYSDFILVPNEAVMRRLMDDNNVITDANKDDVIKNVELLYKITREAEMFDDRSLFLRYGDTYSKFRPRTDI